MDMHQSMHDVSRSADRVKLNRTSTTTFFCYNEKNSRYTHRYRYRYTSLLIPTHSHPHANNDNENEMLTHKRAADTTYLCLYIFFHFCFASYSSLSMVSLKHVYAKPNTKK